MRPLVFLVLVLLFALGQFLLLPDSEGTSTEPDPAARSLRTSLLGGIRPLLVQRAWVAAQDAFEERRPGGVVDALAELRQLDPTDARANWTLARYLAWDISTREPSLPARLDRLEDALAGLDRARQERARRGLPPEKRLSLLGTTILTDVNLWGEGLYDAWIRRRRQSPHEEALLWIDHAREDGGDRDLLLRREGYTLANAALERWVRLGSQDQSVEWMRRAKGVLGEVSFPGVFSRTVSSLTPLMVALVAREATKVAEFAQELVADLSHPEAEVRSAILINAISLSVMELGAELAASGEPEIALSLILAVHSIQGALEALRDGDPETEFTVTDHLPALRSAAKALLSRAPQLHTRVPEALRP